MSDDAITVCIPAIPPRVQSGRLGRAIRSATELQTHAPDALSVVVDTDRRGAPATRQRALDAVRTPLVAFLDDDDEFLPLHLEHLLRHMNETGCDYAFSWFYVISGETVFERDPVFPPSYYLDPWDDAHPRETTITTLVRTELAQEVGFHRLPERKQNTGEDWGFTTGIMSAGGKISHLVEKTWLWRHGSDNTSGLPDRW